MVPVREALILSSRTGSESSISWLYFVAEFLIGAAISGSLGLLSLVKFFLPKPPRDLNGDVVLVTGVKSKLGRSIADEFARYGSTVLCVDGDWKDSDVGDRPIVSRRYYECDLYDRHSIKELAEKIKNDVGTINVLVTCAGHAGQDIFETVNTTLMSHYWTVLAFLPLMIKLKEAFVIGVTPASSPEDAYAGSRAAISGLMESLGQEFSCGNSRLHFITAGPKINPRFSGQSEEKFAEDVVRAVRRNQCTLHSNWFTSFFHRMR